MSHGYNQVLVDLQAIRHNAALLKGAVSPAAMMAVVKANGYGHGLVQTAKAALSGGADALGVACVQEGESLRQHGISAPILVLGLSPAAAFDAAIRAHLTLTICSPDHVMQLQQAAARLGSSAHVHLKVDTGMGRIGVRTRDEIHRVLNALAASPHVQLKGVFTHLAVADEDDDRFTWAQFYQFMDMTKDLPAGILRHCANSAAGLRFPEMDLDMVRFGIALYGYPPVPSDLPLRPAMTWKSQLTWVKTVFPGETVGYGRRYTAAESARIATIPWGYGDGYHRATQGGAVLIRGGTAPIVGRICMDQMMVDVTRLPDVSPGDEVILLGTQGDVRLTADQIAQTQGTISYEVLLSPSLRVERAWLNE